ncbi:hypothetical protein [Frankia sp. Cppng1_Ct_nod]|uniref:hypothetical protein n=1 Tax=Frankia sp. Cppng1_Ct_nod TaxID=2897162 RepID=UPI0010417B69|nr:hypothetical protein [Frankia sp. Cppng1_Ct_nod]
MNPGTGTTAFVAGLVVLAATGRSLLQTVVASHGRPSRLVSRTVLRLTLVARRIGWHLPGEKGRMLLFRMVGPIALIIPPLIWGAGTVIGMALLAVSVGAAPTDVRAVTYVLGQVDGMRWDPNGFTVAVWTCLFLISGVSLARIMTVASAYQRRERLVWVLSNEARSCLDAEKIIVSYVRDGTHDSLDRLLSTWQLWITDLRFSHQSYPELLTLPSLPDLSWLDATLIVLDVAALIDSLTPGIEPPPTRPLLAAGCAFVQEMAKDLQVTTVRTTLSLHGREERSFWTTIARLADSGISSERDYLAAKTTFHRWRSRYAPYVTALAGILSENGPQPVSELMPDSPFGSFRNALELPAEGVPQAFSLL